MLQDINLITFQPYNISTISLKIRNVVKHLTLQHFNFKTLQQYIKYVLVFYLLLQGKPHA